MRYPASVLTCRSLLLAACLTMSVPALAADDTAVLSDLRLIPIQSGPNRIEKFTPDGRAALVTMGYRDNSNAHGSFVFLVMVETKDPVVSEWNVVAVEDLNNHTEYLIHDQPHTGEDYIKSVRFFHGRIDNEPATLLVTATRELSLDQAFPDPARVRFDVYRLRHAPDIGTTPDAFKLELSWKSEKPFCNSDLALALEFNLPLPDHPPANKLPDGCI